jgi:hypothetical protein
MVLRELHELTRIHVLPKSTNLNCCAGRARRRGEPEGGGWQEGGAHGVARPTSACSKSVFIRVYS